MASLVRGEPDEEPRSVERPVYTPSTADKLEWQRRLLVGSKAGAARIPDPAVATVSASLRKLYLLSPSEKARAWRELGPRFQRQALHLAVQDIEEPTVCTDAAAWVTSALKALKRQGAVAELVPVARKLHQLRNQSPFRTSRTLALEVLYDAGLVFDRYDEWV